MRPTLSRRALPWLAAALLAAALPAAAQKIYTWKDAKGVTHYGDAAPAGQKHTERSLGKAPAAAPTAAAKPVVNANCSNARGNLTVLQGKDPVGLDEDKDGKPDRAFTDAERASRVKLAQAAVETYCDAPMEKKQG